MQLKEIKEIYARKIFTSKGKPTIAVSIRTDKGLVESSSPQGTSKGKNEVQDFSVKGIEFSLAFVNAFGKKLMQSDIDLDIFDDLQSIEFLVKKIDSSEDMHIIGGNALFALESALLKSAAQYHDAELWQFILGKRQKTMPKSLGNAIGGGAHSKQEHKTDYQEFLLLPRTNHFFDSHFINLHAYNEAKKMIQERDHSWKGTLTDENAIATTLANSQVLDFLTELKKKIKQKFDIELDIGIDMAASQLWNGSSYVYQNYPSRKLLKREEQLEYVYNLIDKYKLAYVEDPFHEDDFQSFSELQSKIKRKNCLICGDDLTCSNPRRIEKAIREKSISAVIIKPNQIGSLIKMRNSIEMAKENGLVPIISHRSGETPDDALADFAVGLQVPIIKAGIIGKERFVKLNRLLHIERGKDENKEGKERKEKGKKKRSKF